MNDCEKYSKLYHKLNVFNPRVVPLVEKRSKEILNQLANNPELSKYVDYQLPIPFVYRGSGDIKLIILGQDPTLKNPSSRKKIKVVLDLDNKHSNLYCYLNQICRGLGLELEQNIYATNYFKNFFAVPPTTITEINVFQEFASIWLPLVKEELAQFPDVPVITLGEPLLTVICNDDAIPKVRYYWGYVSDWQLNKKGTFKYLDSEKNALNHTVFPFPHQPSIRKRFYDDRLSNYFDFVRPYTNRYVKFIQTNPDSINAIFELAPLSSSDVFYDLGSGDGQILFAAIGKGAGKAIGIENVPRLVHKARETAKQKGLEDKVKIIESDLLQENLSEATVIFYYLERPASKDLKEKFKKELKAGTKVVTETFQIEGWIPNQSRDICYKGGHSEFFLYVMPAHQT